MVSKLATDPTIKSQPDQGLLKVSSAAKDTKKGSMRVAVKPQTSKAKKSIVKTVEAKSTTGTHDEANLTTARVLVTQEGVLHLSREQTNQEWQRIKEKVKRQTLKSTEVAMNRLSTPVPTKGKASPSSMSNEQMTAMLKKAGLLTESGKLPVSYR